MMYDPRLSAFSGDGPHVARRHPAGTLLPHPRRVDRRGAHRARSRDQRRLFYRGAALIVAGSLIILFVARVWAAIVT